MVGPQTGVTVVCLEMRDKLSQMDVHSPERRRHNMSQIRSRDTGPEMVLRRLLHAHGYRYRVNVRNLPGSPDLVFTGRHKVIFVNGCFWHSHNCKYGSVTPKTNAEFWASKRSATTDRDLRTTMKLESMGWQVMTVWECELREPEDVLGRVSDFLG